jgi:hypothetical protein
VAEEEAAEERVCRLLGAAEAEAVPAAEPVAPLLAMAGAEGATGGGGAAAAAVLVPVEVPVLVLLPVLVPVLVLVGLAEGTKAAEMPAEAHRALLNWPRKEASELDTALQGTAELLLEDWPTRVLAAASSAGLLPKKKKSTLMPWLPTACSLRLPAGRGKSTAPEVGSVSLDTVTSQLLQAEALSSAELTEPTRALTPAELLREASGTLCSTMEEKTGLAGPATEAAMFLLARAATRA